MRTRCAFRLGSSTIVLIFGPVFLPYFWSALQIYQKWGEKAGPKIKTMVHRSREARARTRAARRAALGGDEYRNRIGLRGAKFASWYCLPDDDHVIGEGGFEFPFTATPGRISASAPYSEGPVAYAIAEIMSPQEDARRTS